MACVAGKYSDVQQLRPPTMFGDLVDDPRTGLVDLTDPYGDADDLSPMRGVLMGVALSIPTIAASCRWLRNAPCFSAISTSHIERDPPTCSNASSKARSTSRATLASI